MIHLYTGDGKGKTTAAIGLAVRAAGDGMNVFFSQFMKGNDTGELHALRQLPNVRILRSDRDFGFYRSQTPEDKAALTEIHNQILDELITAARSGQTQMIILDEITYPVQWHLLDEGKLRELLACAGGHAVSSAVQQNSLPDFLPELVLTGRNPADFLTDTADYITEMKAVRHPFTKGVGARRGVEY